AGPPPRPGAERDDPRPAAAARGPAGRHADGARLPGDRARFDAQPARRIAPAGGQGDAHLMADDPATAAPPTPSPAQLVYLDVDDEITSAAARIRATDAERITLVLPYGSRLATSRINFRLLAREATDRGKRLDIVCGDASARALAAAAGLPVHAAVAAYEAARDGVAGEAPSANGHDVARAQADV